MTTGRAGDAAPAPDASPARDGGPSRLGAPSPDDPGLGPARRLAASVLAGAALALAQPPLGLWPAIFVGGAALYLLWRGATGRALFLTGWGGGFGFFAATLHWIVEPFLVDVARHGWMAPFALVLLAGGLALFWGAGFWAAAAIRRRLGPGGALTGVVCLTLGWTGAEFARSFVLTGFPWALPTYVWVGTPVAQVAALIGPYGLSLLTLFLAVLAGAAAERGRRPFERAFVALGLIAALGVGWGWGAQRLAAASTPSPAPAGERPLIRILQTAVPQAEKWAPERRASNFEMLVALSEGPATPKGGAGGEADAGRAPDVILWPESAVTFAFDQSPDAATVLADRLGGASVAVGTLRAAGEGEAARWRNSVYLVDAAGVLSAPFDKIHLVPFGEYLPLQGLMNHLGLGAFTGQGIEAGETPVLMTPAGAPPFAPLICYEMIFPRETARAAKGASWMMLATNDAWFGAWAGPLQHFAIARMRAIETGLPIARSANAGVSAMIDPYGRADAALSPGAARVIDAPLPDSVSPTPYARYGELFCALAVCIIIPLATQRLRWTPLA